MFNEKFLWLDSLSTADPTYALPALFVTIGLLNFKVFRNIQYAMNIEKILIKRFIAKVFIIRQSAKNENKQNF